MPSWAYRWIALLVLLSLGLGGCAPAATPAPTKPAAQATTPAAPATTPAAKTAASPVASPVGSPAATKPAASPVAKTTGATAPAAATGGPLKIGVLVPFTGDLSDFGPAMYNSAQLAVEEINGAGGVNGQPIQIVRGDSATSPQQGVQEARRMVEVESVNAIVGAAASGVTLQIAESVTASRQILQISPSATSPALTVARDNDFLFRTTISDAAQGIILGDLAKEQGFTSACTMYVNNAYGQGLSEQFTKRFQALGGRVTAQVPHEQEQASYAAELQRCTQEKPDVLVAISYPQSAGVYLREAVEQGLVKQFLFTDGPKSQDLFDKLGAQNFEGMFGTAPGALDTQIGRAFDEAYTKKYGSRPQLPYLRESYDAVYAIALAAQKARSTNSAAIRDALRDVTNPAGDTINPGPDGWKTALAALQAGRDINYEGAANTTNFDQNGDVLTGAVEIWRIQDGKIAVIETRDLDLARQ